MTGLRWGIMGTGGIAASMAEALQSVGSSVVAVGSERAGAAERFAEEWKVPRALNSHRAVAEVDEVDLIYVATTNDRHYDNVLACVASEKPALCEKPIALNARQAGEMMEAARKAGVFLMEALWMRFQPFMAKVDELISDGAVGTVKHVQADLSFLASTDPTRRWVGHELGGGSLLDLGIYPLSLVHHLLGSPIDFQANADIGPTGVDLDVRVISRHPGGASATTTCAFTADLTNEALVSGTEGRLRAHTPFHHSPLVTLEQRGEVRAAFDTSYAGHGFQFEVAETERCVKEGLAESPLRPHHDTLAVMEWMDAIRAHIGVEYPADVA